MFFKVFRDIARPQWFALIQVLKCSTGLSVAELAKALKMSYMGVKGHCVELERLGYLDTWRRPKAVGRPEKAYRLTDKANALFPQVGPEFSLALLDAVAGIHGHAAAEKLLFGYFQQRGERYAKKLKGETLAERATALARQREAEGYLSSCESDAEGALQIVEHHTPYREIADRFPTVYRMEAGMFAKVLNAKVERDEERASGLVRAVFRIFG